MELLISKKGMMDIIEVFMVKGHALLRRINTSFSEALKMQKKKTLLVQECYKSLFRDLDLLIKKSIYIPTLYGFKLFAACATQQHLSQDKDLCRRP